MEITVIKCIVLKCKFVFSFQHPIPEELENSTAKVLNLDPNVNNTNKYPQLKHLKYRGTILQVNKYI